jgi:hypothetical protein
MDYISASAARKFPDGKLTFALVKVPVEIKINLPPSTDGAPHEGEPAPAKLAPVRSDESVGMTRIVVENLTAQAIIALFV